MTRPPDSSIARILGLTGGIGSGKSAAALIFAEFGAKIVDVDAIAHELTASGGRAIGPIRQTFGDIVIAADGALDRVAMRHLAFTDADAKARLEAILHPMIGLESHQRCEDALAAGAPYVVLVVPLLVESGAYRRRVARIAVVDCSEETQIGRVMARSGLGRDEVGRIMAAQVSRAERQAVADDIIDNEGDLAGLRVRIRELHDKYMALLHAKNSLSGG